MGERWREPDRQDGKNGVEDRVISDAIEREWLTGLFSSVGQEPADAGALLQRMRERRRIGLRRAATDEIGRASHS